MSRDQIKKKIRERITDFKQRAAYWQARNNAGARELMKHCEARALEAEAILQLFGGSDD